MGRKRGQSNKTAAKCEEIVLIGDPVWVSIVQSFFVGAGLVVGFIVLAMMLREDRHGRRVVLELRNRISSGARYQPPRHLASAPKGAPTTASTNKTKVTTKEGLLYEYRADLIHVVDGDTVDLSVDLGFYMQGRIRFRLAEIDTPEIRGAERPEGLKAKAYVEERLGKAEDIMIRTEKAGKYGRWIADIFYRLPDDPAPTVEKGDDGETKLVGTWRHLNKELLEKDLAEPY